MPTNPDLKISTQIKWKDYVQVLEKYYAMGSKECLKHLPAGVTSAALKAAAMRFGYSQPSGRKYKERAVKEVAVEIIPGARVYKVDDHDHSIGGCIGSSRKSPGIQCGFGNVEVMYG